MVELRQADEGVEYIPWDGESQILDGDLSEIDAIVTSRGTDQSIYDEQGRAVFGADDNVALGEEMIPAKAGERALRPRDLTRARKTVQSYGKRAAPVTALTVGYTEADDHVDELPDHPLR
jgi:hypothetical protein